MGGRGPRRSAIPFIRNVPEAPVNKPVIGLLLGAALGAIDGGADAVMTVEYARRK